MPTTRSIASASRMRVGLGHVSAVTRAHEGTQPPAAGSAVVDRERVEGACVHRENRSGNAGGKAETASGRTSAVSRAPDRLRQASAATGTARIAMMNANVWSTPSPVTLGSRHARIR